MLSWLKDIPESLVGTALALALWFAFNYIVLAPRAMGQLMARDIYPHCVAELAAAQQATLDKALQAARQAQSVRQAELAEQESKLLLIDQYTNLQRQSGLSQLLRASGLPSVSGDDVQALRKQLAAAQAAASVLPSFEAFTLSSADLLKTCGCAGLQVMTGVRVDYAIHTASFRLVEPTSLARLKQQVSELTGTGGCGALPWEELNHG